MNEYDGKIDSAIDGIKKFRWVLEIRKHGRLLLGDCFVSVKLHEFDQILKSLNNNEKKIHYQFLNVEAGSPVYQSVEALQFTDYEISQSLHEGHGMPGKLIETWRLPGAKISERVFTGQRNGLFTIGLDITYNQIEHIPGVTD